MAESEEHETHTEKWEHERVRGVEREEGIGKEHVSMAESARRRSVTTALTVRASARKPAEARWPARAPTRRTAAKRARADASASVSEQQRPPVMWTARYSGSV